MRWLWYIIGYLALLVVIITAMFQLRRSVITQQSTPQAMADWENWREDVRRQQGEQASIRRAVPKSGEPPALVLMRDYFAACIAIVVAFGSVIYGILAWFVNGMMKSSLHSTRLE